MTGLFFGSFNPIHNGHLKIATYILDNCLCDEVWFVVSPRNPLKQDSGLLDEYKRKEMVELATAADSRMRVCDIEFSMPKPSYTIDTLKKITETYPDREVALIIGEDNLQKLHLWKDYQQLCSGYKILVYPRPGVNCPELSYPGVVRINAPLSDISSTDIRLKVKRGEEIGMYVPASIHDLIINHYA